MGPHHPSNPALKFEVQTPVGPITTPPATPRRSPPHPSAAASRSVRAPPSSGQARVEIRPGPSPLAHPLVGECSFRTPDPLRLPLCSLCVSSLRFCPSNPENSLSPSTSPLGLFPAAAPAQSNSAIIRVGSSNSPRETKPAEVRGGAVCLPEILGIPFNPVSLATFRLGILVVGRSWASIGGLFGSWDARISRTEQTVQIRTVTEGNSLSCEPAVNFLHSRGL